MIVIPVQTVLLIYARRSRVNLRYPWIKFWVLGLMYYNLSDWLGIAWVAEEYPGVRALDVCAGDYLGAGEFYQIDFWRIISIINSGMIHLLVTFVIFYRFTAWRQWNMAISRSDCLD